MTVDNKSFGFQNLVGMVAVVLSVVIVAIIGVFARMVSNCTPREEDAELQEVQAPGPVEQLDPDLQALVDRVIEEVRDQDIYKIAREINSETEREYNQDEDCHTDDDDASYSDQTDDEQQQEHRREVDYSI